MTAIPFSYRDFHVAPEVGGKPEASEINLALRLWLLAG
jgi:hypothetical protein